MKLAIIGLVALFAAACNNAASPVQSNNSAKANPAASGTPQTVIAHSSENKQPNAAPAPGEKGKWTQSGEPIDTKELDAAVTSAEKALSAKSADDKLKKALAEAYFKRAVALTDARQYASAIGDYRRAYKNDPTKTEAKEWVDKIIMIYDGLNKSYPKEGEEPPPLPFTKDK